MRYKPSTLRERLWRRVVKKENCWEWTGSRDRKGYGRIGERQVPLLVHRVAFELEYGPIPAGLNVLHKCDNPPCCNPVHLFLGTLTDNARDCAAKNRTRFGERATNVTLTAKQVAEIRASYADTTMPELVARYGVTKDTIHKILVNMTWRRELGGDGAPRRCPRPQSKLAGENGTNVKLTLAQVNEVRRLYAAGGETHRSLGVKFKVTHQTIGNLIRLRTWREYGEKQ